MHLHLRNKTKALLGTSSNSVFGLWDLCKELIENPSTAKLCYDCSNKMQMAYIGNTTSTYFIIYYIHDGSWVDGHISNSFAWFVHSFIHSVYFIFLYFHFHNIVHKFILVSYIKSATAE